MRKVLNIVALVARVLAWAVTALVAADAFIGSGSRTWLLAVNGAVSRLVPSQLLGLFVFSTPFGGAFRGDYAILAIVLLVIDWVLTRVSASLR